MKIKWFVTGFLLLVLFAEVQLHAQQSDTNSVESIKAKAEKGEAKAQYDLGCYYGYNSQGKIKDGAEAVKWFRKAAEQGNVEAQAYLGILLSCGEGVKRDGAEALKWFRKAAEQGVASAQYNLANSYFDGRDGTQDYVEAVKWYRKAAEQNDADAQRRLGEIYNGGEGVTRDPVEAVKWYRKAAEQGVTSAQYFLGAMYGNGEGIEKDSSEAVKWFRKAAEQGLAEGQFGLGRSYFNGDGVNKDIAEGLKWIQKAAEQGEVQAQKFLATGYLFGVGMETNEEKGIMWFRKAAEQGDVKAQSFLGAMFANGVGVKKNSSEGVKWLRAAANQGFAKAQYDLGRLYYLGDGVLIDYAEGVKWNALAAAQGNDDAVNMWNYVLKEKVPADQIAEGQRRAAAFVPHKEISGQQSSSSANSNSPANPSITGTGFFITDDGYLISNYHVVKGAAKVRLLTGAGLIDATVLKVDAANDLALLKAAGRFAPLPIAASRTVKLGATVATVGFPDTGLQGFSPKLAKGEIGSLAGIQDDPRYFQISVPVQPGNSGGALVDARGNVVGIVSAKLSAKAALDATGALPENVNYAVKSSLLLSFLESVPEVSAKLKDPNTKDEAFEDVVKSAQDAAVLVLVY